MKKLVSLISAVAMLAAASSFTVALAEDAAVDFMAPSNGVSSYRHTTGHYTSGILARFEGEDFINKYGNDKYWYVLDSKSTGEKFGLTGASKDKVAATRDQNTSGYPCTTEEAYFTIKVNMPVTGYYQFGAAVAARTYSSGSAVSFNGGAYEDIRYLTGENNSAASTDYTGVQTIDNSSAFGCILYRRNNPVLLNEGENTIVIKSTKRIGSDSRVFAAVDFIDLSFVRAAYSTNTVEAEEQLSDLAFEIKSASGNKVAKYGVGSDTSKSLALTVNAPSTGIYTLKIGAAIDVNHSWLSPMYITANGVKKGLNVEQMTQYIFSADAATFTPALYTVPGVKLNEGANTLTFDLKERTDGGIFFALDFVDSIKTGEAATVGKIEEIISDTQIKDTAKAFTFDVTPNAQSVSKVKVAVAGSNEGAQTVPIPTVSGAGTVSFGIIFSSADTAKTLPSADAITITLE